MKEKVGANARLAHAALPQQRRWSLPDGCDNLGSPYAVRDYFHAERHALARLHHRRTRRVLRRAVLGERRARSRSIASAHAAGTKVLLDVALNHFGHNYLLYDFAGRRARRRSHRRRREPRHALELRRHLRRRARSSRGRSTRRRRSTASPRAATRTRALPRRPDRRSARTSAATRSCAPSPRIVSRCRTSARSSRATALPRAAGAGFYLGADSRRPVDAPRRQLHEQLARREVPLSTTRRTARTSWEFARDARVPLPRPQLLDVARRRRLPLRSHHRLLRRHGLERVEVPDSARSSYYAAEARAGAPRLPRRGVRRSRGDEQGRRHPHRGLRRRHDRPRRRDQGHAPRRGRRSTT